MSTEQPTALWFADKLEYMPAGGHWVTAHNAAAELRRLHSVNSDLLEALHQITKVYGAMRENLSKQYPHDGWSAETMTLDKARAAIAKATGEHHEHG